MNASAGIYKAIFSALALLAIATPAATCFAQTADVQTSDVNPPLERIKVSDDGSGFVTATSRETFTLWGVNYDHDFEGELLEDYWHDHWPTIVEDFGEIKDLNANVVRIHLQFSAFMKSPDEPNRKSLEQLKKLVALAEEKKLYLNITGLGCYHKQDVPAWYDELSTEDRWDAQANFWRHVAAACSGSPAVFCFDLMNEPILPAKTPDDQWLAGELGGKYFVQRIALDLGDKSRTELAAAWVKKLSDAIREEDEQTLITVGVIPWMFVFGGGKPLFYSDEVGGPLDFVSVHFYPRKGEVDKAVAALKKYDLGKPLVVEEMFPLRSSTAEVQQFIDQTQSFTDGYFSFYWGRTTDEYKAQGDMKGAIIAGWLKAFEEKGQAIASEP